MDNMESIARQTLAAINPNLSVVKFQTFDEQIADRFTQDRMITRLMTLFSILALLLASLGLYGVTAYTVARRTSEIGIRMALGANRGSVVGMIMRRAMLQTAIGLAAIGIPVAWFCVRYIESQLYESKGMSVAVLSIATLTLTAAAAAAAVSVSSTRSLNQSVASFENRIAIAICSLVVELRWKICAQISSFGRTVLHEIAAMGLCQRATTTRFWKPGHMPTSSH
jgi:ABC-type antimicrobial peptide transport system permease subunit